MFCVSVSHHNEFTMFCDATSQCTGLVMLLCYLQDVRNPCVTPIVVPEGVAWKDVADYAMKK